MQYIVTVKPGSSQEKIVEHPDGTLVVYLRARPHDGEANAALVKLLAKHFHVGKTAIHLTRGAHSHTKTVEIDS